jgi:hydrogenase maturation protease
MSTLLIAIGNSLRRDDGVAHRVLDLLGDAGADVRSVLQLTPELSEEISRYDQVVFLDADVGASDLNVLDPSRAGQSRSVPRMEVIEMDSPACSPLGHSFAAAEIAALSRSLYNFDGEAILCRIPVSDFGEGESLSRQAETNAHLAAALLRDFLQRQA